MELPPKCSPLLVVSLLPAGNLARWGDIENFKKLRIAAGAGLVLGKPAPALTAATPAFRLEWNLCLPVHFGPHDVGVKGVQFAVQLESI